MENNEWIFSAINKIPKKPLEAYYTLYIYNDQDIKVNKKYVRT